MAPQIYYTEKEAAEKYRNEKRLEYNTYLKTYLEDDPTHTPETFKKRCLHHMAIEGIRPSPAGWCKAAKLETELLEETRLARISLDI
jgi:hypothetical protein